jgi:hypothetical protein
MRQPVSPMTTIRFTDAGGSGIMLPSMMTFFDPGGMTFSQVRTGKAEGLLSSGDERVGRKGSVSARERTFIVKSAPSMRMDGHDAVRVITRATGVPPSPSTMNMLSWPGQSSIGLPVEQAPRSAADRASHAAQRGKYVGNMFSSLNSYSVLYSTQTW